MDESLLHIAGLCIKATGWAFLPILLVPLISLFAPKLKWVDGFQYSLIRSIDQLNMTIAEIVKWLLVVLVICVAMSVVALSIFGMSWTKLDEAAIYFHASVILLGSAATLLANEHVRVDIFYAYASSKAKALINLIGFYALLTPFCIIIIWNAQSFIGLAWASFEGSAESDGIRGVFILKTMLGIFAITLLAQGLSISCRAALYLTGKATPPRPKQIDPLFRLHERESGL